MGLIFAVLAVMTVFSALGVVFLGRNSVHTAMYLVGTLLCIAANFLLLGAEFLAFAQVIVYAGAIVVLFLFIVMLLNLRESDIAPASQFGRKVLALAFAIVFAFVLYQVTAEPPARALQPIVTTDLDAPGAATLGLAQALLTRYLLPFELTSILLLIAIIGAVAIGRRELNFPSREAMRLPGGPSGSGPR